jgi:hypothetical protein
MDINSIRLGDARFSRVQQWIPGLYSSIQIAVYTNEIVCFVDSGMGSGDHQRSSPGNAQ